MICFRDRTYCAASRNSCFNRECPRFFSEQDAIDADLWWKDMPGDAPVAFADFKTDCTDVVPEDDHGPE